tara:strand:+ start:119 stop:454 length:336 start_codon:yes stop_codon:yes gene_type:complete
MFDRRGAPRKVKYRQWKTMKDARTQALIANWKIQELKHQVSRFRDRVPGGFRKASTLQDWTEMESEKDKLQKLSEKRERNIQTKQIADEEGCETVSNGLKRKTSCFRRFFG